MTHPPTTPATTLTTTTIIATSIFATTTTRNTTTMHCNYNHLQPRTTPVHLITTLIVAIIAEHNWTWVDVMQFFFSINTTILITGNNHFKYHHYKCNYHNNYYHKHNHHQLSWFSQPLSLTQLPLDPQPLQPLASQRGTTSKNYHYSYH